jgi:hypothetical protein
MKGNYGERYIFFPYQLTPLLSLKKKANSPAQVSGLKKIGRWATIVEKNQI